MHLQYKTTHQQRLIKIATNTILLGLAPELDSLLITGQHHQQYDKHTTEIRLRLSGQLGHTTVVMTEIYIRQRGGKKATQPNDF